MSSFFVREMFLKGRTEALRTVTAEAKAFLEAFTDPDAPEVGVYSGSILAL